MKTKLIIAVIIIAIIVPLVLVLTALQRGGKDKTFNLSKGGETIEVRDLSEDPSIVPAPDGYYISDNDQYNIYFDRSNNEYRIALLRQPIASARQAAEDSLVVRLGVTKEDACKLGVLVSVPVRVDPEYSDQNLGLSFCPGAIELK